MRGFLSILARFSRKVLASKRLDCSMEVVRRLRAVEMGTETDGERGTKSTFSQRLLASLS